MSAVRTERMAAHPNDLDRKRIERALRDRRRYRYVEPSVKKVEGGYRIESPCCSRNIDPEGGIVDVALLSHDGERGVWCLFWKNHAKGLWELDRTCERLHELMDRLNIDEERKFWQ